MVIIMIISMLAFVVTTGPGDYVNTDKNQTHTPEPGGNRR